jgi:hypothetical protein
MKLMSLKDTNYKNLNSWLRATILRFAKAEVEDSWKSSRDPECFSLIEEELRAAEHELKSVLACVDAVIDHDLRARFSA